MDAAVDLRQWMEGAGAKVLDRLPLLLGVLTVTGFLSGLAYFQGYFGRLGLDALVYSLPFEMYLAAGGISVVAALLVMAFVAVASIYLVLRLGPRLVKRQQRVAAREGSGHHPLLVLLSGLLLLIVVFVWPWRWLVSVASLLPAAIPLWLTLALLLLLLPGVLLAHLVVMRSLKGRTAIAYLLLVLVASAPLLAQQAGEYRAEHLFDNPDRLTRALVWWTENSTAPSGYLVVHQEGSLVYLVAQVERGPGGPVFYSTVVDLTSVARIAFVPPGADLTLVNPSASPET